MDFIKKKDFEDIYDRCRYLNYLINSNNEYNNFSSYEISKLFEAYKYLASTLTICNSHIEHIKNGDVLQRITKLNNLYEALNNIEKSQTTQVQKICTYTEQFAKHYENSKDHCRNFGHPAFCGELEKIEQTFYHLMKSIDCPEATKILESLVQPGGHVTILVPCIILFAMSFFLYILYKVNNYYIEKYSFLQ